jgi:hypothetical protein
MSGAGWDGRDPVGTVARWLDEALEHGRIEAERRRETRAANLEAARKRGTCAIGHPIYVTSDAYGPTWARTWAEGSRCSYCHNARHEGVDA